MLIELMTLAAIYLLLTKKKADCIGTPGVYFTWDELTTTNQAAPNNPSGPQCSNLKRLTHDILDPLRFATGAPIYVNSAYRSNALNNLLIARGYPAAHNSLHLAGKAADIRSNKYTPAELRQIILDRGIPHGELIVYQDYLHVSL